MSIPSPSRIYREAAGLPIDKTRAPAIADRDGVCAMCGVPVAKGDPCKPVTKDTFPDSFNNTGDLAARWSRYICGDCATLWQKDFLQKYSKTVANRHGVFKLASNEDYADLVMRPPEPPFVAILSTAQQQHLIWRTPVSTSRRVFFVRLGDEVLKIRRSWAVSGLECYAKLLELMEAHKLKGQPCFFDRALAKERICSVRDDVHRLATKEGLVSELVVLNNMTIGEWWALNTLRQVFEDELRKLNEGDWRPDEVAADLQVKPWLKKVLPKELAD